MEVTDKTQLYELSVNQLINLINEPDKPQKMVKQSKYFAEGSGVDAPMYLLSVGELKNIIKWSKEGKKRLKNIPVPTPVPTVEGMKGLSELLDCSEFTAKRLYSEGRIPFTKVGRCIFFNVDIVVAFVKSNPNFREEFNKGPYHLG